MVQAVNGDPLDRPILKGQTAEYRQGILQRLPQLKGAVGQQPVVAEADS